MYTRAQRIVDKAAQDLPDLRAELLLEAAELEVANAVRAFEATAAGADEFETVFSAAEQLAEPLERFFEDVLVMAEDRELQRNRLRLLADVRDAVRARLGDLSQIPR